MRALRKNPAFAAAAIVTIALGSGAAIAMFSVTDAVLLRPLPYRNAGRTAIADGSFSNAGFHDLRRGVGHLFEDLAAVMVYRAVVPREDGTAERITRAQVTVNFMPLMGAAIALGRGFHDEDGRPAAQLEPLFPPPEGKVAILSNEYWQRRYGGDPAVLGREMPGSSGRGPRIIGVLAPGFRLLLPARVTAEPTPDIWIPNDRGYDAAHRGDLMLRVIGTLREGASLESVEAAARAAPGRRARFERLRDALVREVRPAIAALMGAVVFLLFVACANVANLMLVRAWSRSREVAVRSALGASPARLVRLVAAEAVLLAGAGTLAGVALAAAVLDRLPAIASADLPRLDTIRIDWRVLAFAAFAGLAQALVFALAAAWRGARPDIMQTLRGGAHVLRPGAGSLARSGVVVAQVALSFVLLTGCGLMFRSYVALRRVDPGYEPRGLLTFLATGEARRVPPRRRAAFLRDIHERLRALPG